MPIYVYQCTQCGAEHEAMQKISDALLTKCPKCHAQALRKKVTAAGFQLKGSGWYVTDFRGGNQPQSESAQPAKASDSPASTPTSSSAEATQTSSTKAQPSRDAAKSTTNPVAA